MFFFAWRGHLCQLARTCFPYTTGPPNANHAKISNLLTSAKPRAKVEVLTREFRGSRLADSFDGPAGLVLVGLMSLLLVNGVALRLGFASSAAGDARREGPRSESAFIQEPYEVSFAG